MQSCRETYIERRKEESSNDRNDRAIRVAARWEMAGQAFYLIKK